MADNFIDNNGTSRYDRNRANDTRRDNDSFKTPAITLYDIDYSILHFLKEQMNFQIEENGKKIPVPVLYAGGETWTQIQRHGYLRDKTRKILTPIIVLKRSSMAADDRFSWLDARAAGFRNSIIFSPYTSPNPVPLFPDRQQSDQYDQFSETTNSRKNQTYYMSVIPEFVKITYDVYIWTELVTQMNSIVEKLRPQDRLVWGDQFQFVTKVSEMTFEHMNDTGQDRIVRCQLSLEVDGRLQEEYELFESNITKAHSIKRFVFENEIEQTEIYPDHKPKIIRFGKSRLPEQNFE